MGNSEKTLRQRYLKGEQQLAMQRAVDEMAAFTKVARGEAGAAEPRAAQPRAAQPRAVQRRQKR